MYLYTVFFEKRPEGVAESSKEKSSLPLSVRDIMMLDLWRELAKPVNSLTEVE